MTPPDLIHGPSTEAYFPYSPQLNTPGSRLEYYQLLITYNLFSPVVLYIAVPKKNTKKNLVK